MVVPPLREHKEDIPSLIDAFISDFNRRSGGKIQGIAPQVLKILMEYDWPGNVRQIKNAIESASVLASGDTISAESFADLVSRSARLSPEATPATIASGSLTLSLGVPLAEAERQIILANLRHYPNRAATAKALGIGLRTLYTKLREYGIYGRGAGADSA